MKPQFRKTISLLLKAGVIISAALGTFLSARAARGTFMGGSVVFMYFTIQSNIAVAVISAVGAYLMLRDKAVRDAWYIVMFVGAVAITLTGMVFTVILAPTLGAQAWNVQNVLTHVVVPVASVADFFVAAAGRTLQKKNVMFVVIPPMLYVVYAGLGYILGWEFGSGRNYPYFFLNWGSPAGAFGFASELPFMGCVWWILLLLAFLIAVGFFYLFVLDKLSKKRSFIAD